MKLIKILEVKIKKLKAIGKNDFHPNCINWSYRYLGNVARVSMKKIAPIAIFKLSQILPGRRQSGSVLNSGNQPPKNKMAAKELIKSIFEYSAKKNKAKVIAEYSTL